jgi:hypothetical protein
MGTERRLSTPPANGFCAAPFSGKLSTVTPNSADQVPTLRSADAAAAEHQAAPAPATDPRLREVAGREGPEPTRYGDWELRGRCIDF